MADILAQGNARWPEFVDRLCDALDDEPCQHRTMERSRSVLKAMEEMAVAASMEMLSSVGATCDCCVLGLDRPPAA